MANSKKRKSGLHKEISSIFDGVPLPQDQQPTQPSRGAEQGQAGHDSLRSSGTSPENPQIPGSNQRFKQAARIGGVTHSSAAAGRKGAIQQITDKLFAPRPGVSPTRQKVMVLLIPALFIVLLVFGRGVFKTPSSSKKTWEEPSPKLAANKTETDIVWQKPKPYPVGLRDPMQSPTEAGGGPGIYIGPGPTPSTDRAGGLTVKGILFSIDNPTAVIGTRIVHIGDTVAGVTITNITKNEVEFEKDGKKWSQAVEP